MGLVNRTAWLMAAMSDLAYFKFEGGEDFVSLATDLVSMGDASDIKERLRKFLREMDTDAKDGKSALQKALKVAGFDLVNVYNIADTQAFLAKKPSTKSTDGIRILAFRGTEQKLGDFKADLQAALIAPPEGDTHEKVHQGFYEAFMDVKKDIERDLKTDSNIPLYITGHSLGGALAVVATRFIAGESLGACYTFGSPRVGNLDLSLKFKTPIYRVVNAADIVPRVPPAHIIPLLVAIIKITPLPLEWLSEFLERFRGYIHFGDMRYLNHVPPGLSDEFEGLRLISNPSLPLRAGWVVRRWIETFGKGAIQDHSISLYRRKLKAYALFRN